MGNSVRLRALALVTAGILGTWSLGGAAAADPTSDHADQGQHLGQTKDPAQGAGKDKGKDQGKGQSGQGKDKGKDKGKHTGHAHAPGQVANPGHQGGQGHGPAQGGQGHGPAQGQGQGQGQGQSHTPGNPPGNNGTVKIAGPGDEVGHPSNNPHPGCTFYVEWFGFDEGAD
ncbi:MAG TPA: hypothetical protein VGE43_07140, partial [Acidimicrobiales bacterium]